MKRLVLLAVALALSTAATAQLYKWVDKDGRVTYSDQPPPSVQSKQINVNTGLPTAASRSALERDKELEKGRQAAKEKAKTADEEGKRAEMERENCRKARANLASLASDGRVAIYDEKGERTVLDDAQIAAERAKAQKAVDEYCKN